MSARAVVCVVVCLLIAVAESKSCGPCNIRCAYPGVPTCNHTMGHWYCKQPAEEVSEDKCNDFYYKMCQTTSDCKVNHHCEMQEGCVSSACGCEPSTGEKGICTADCNTDVGLCVADAVKDHCSDFYYKTCASSADCKAGFECTPQSGCVSSSCMCDPATGNKICTKDCRRDIGVCKDPCEDFYYKVCQSNEDCKAGYECVRAAADKDGNTPCVSSICTCDEGDNMPICTEDCRQNVGKCQKTVESF
eukprot:GILK01006367.1.p1 GENE.GILK01006367.1~~GILK01006367.1.p1  ORF type:complete len:261 (-),score=31.41 GILK01006367.1:166-906(-)